MSIVPKIHRVLKARFMVAVLAAFVAVTALVTVPLDPHTAAIAAPDGSQDDEGGTLKLRQALDTAGRGYSTASKALKASQARQKQIQGQVDVLQKQVGVLSKNVNLIARGAYTGTGVTTMNAMDSLLADGSINEYAAKMTTVTMMAQKTDNQLKSLSAAKASLHRQRTSINAEVTKQQQQVTIMSKRKADATKALRDAGGGEYIDGPTGNGRAARSGERGSSCSLEDPTGGSCLTSTMLHAYKEARAAGFTRYTHCNRSASFGEHPKGRACDFAVDKGGFGGVASGASKTYGNSLSAWVIKNSDTLDVMYVIWFRKIWMPGSGWQSYSSGGGDPSSDHTNHVHVSVN